jgi:hypothetical protein
MEPQVVPEYASRSLELHWNFRTLDFKSPALQKPGSRQYFPVRSPIATIKLRLLPSHRGWEDENGGTGRLET